MPLPGDVVRAEANTVENTLNLPASEVRGYLEQLLFTPTKRDETDDTRNVFSVGLIQLATTPWELTHARRVYRLIAANLLESAGREPAGRWQRDEHSRAAEEAWNSLPEPLRLLFYPQHDYLFADAQNEVAHRALVQVFAIRSWQLKHEGRFPENLEALVPEELPTLPTDPYSGRPFGYRPSRREGLLSLDHALAGVQPTIESSLIKPPQGSWLLYSVGIDQRDDGGIATNRKENGGIVPGSDMVFAIPPLEGNTSGEGKSEAKSTTKPEAAPAKPK